MRGERSRRTVLVGAALMAVAGVAIADAVVAPPPPAVEAAPADAVVAGTHAASSAWYCAGLAAAPSGTQASVLITNSTARTVTGLINTIPVGTQTGALQGYSVPPDQQVTLPLVAGADAILVNGGGVGIEQVLTGPLGTTAAPCASDTAANWYFAQGSTASGHGFQVALFNPLPTPAVVDVSFVSQSAGVEVPPAYQGIPIASGTVVVENVSDHLSGDPLLATEVTALSGSVAAAEVDEAAGPGSGGLSVVDGASQPLTRWALAVNADVSGGGNSFNILNPSSRPTTVTVSIALAQGQASPLRLPVPAQSLVSFVAQDQTRIPASTLYGITFASSRSAIVVARQTVSAGAVTPALGTSQAQPGGIRRWLIPAVAPGELPWGLALVDLARRPVQVRIEGWSDGKLVPLMGDSKVTLEPAVLQVIMAPVTPVGWTPTVVSADGPVAVELDPSPATPPGTDPVPAWPLL